MPRNKHIVVDRLLRRPRTALDDIDKANKVKIDDFINSEIYYIHVRLVLVKEVGEGEPTLYIEDRYSLDSWLITEYLSTLRLPK